MSTFRIEVNADELRDVLSALKAEPFDGELAAKIKDQVSGQLPWTHRDRLAAMVYQARAQSPTEQTPESWDRACTRFRTSTSQCYDEVDRMVEDDEVELLDD